MAKPTVHLSDSDIEKLISLVHGNNNAMLSKSIRENWAKAYKVAESTVYKRIKGIIAASYKNGRGQWVCARRYTTGELVTQGSVQEIEAAVNYLKATGQVVDIKYIANKYGVTEDYVSEIVYDMTH